MQKAIKFDIKKILPKIDNIVGIGDVKELWIFGKYFIVVDIAARHPRFHTGHFIYDCKVRACEND